MNSRRRALITGRGVCSPIGCGWRSFEQAIRLERAASPAPFPGSTGDAPPHCFLLPDGVPDTGGRSEPLSAVATVCAREALDEACILRDGKHDGIGLVMNTVLGPSHAVEAYIERLRQRGPRASRPAQFVDTLLSMPASRVGIALGLRGGAAVLGGSSALDLAFDWVRSGREEAVLAGGAEYHSPKCLRYHRALAERSGNERAPLAQGAGFLLVEAAGHAAERAAPVLGELLGWGGASEPQDVSVPWSNDASGGAFARAIGCALEDARLGPADIDGAVLAAGDDAAGAGELAALRAVFGDAAGSLRLLRPKRLMGEALGAAEALGSLATLAAFDGGATILVNAFEMGGAASALVVRVGQ